MILYGQRNNRRIKAGTMFHVKIDTIRERTTNGPTYMKGRQYYRQGQVKHLTFDQEKGIVLAQVEGTRTYNVRIILDGKGELHDASCTCSAFSAYWGLCRHIAATLLYCVDTFGQEKTHIIPAMKPDEDLEPLETATLPPADEAGFAGFGCQPDGRSGPASCRRRGRRSARTNPGRLAGLGNLPPATIGAPAGAKAKPQQNPRLSFPYGSCRAPDGTGP